MKKLLLVMLFTMFPVLAHGATYYVAKTGSDSNSCSNAQSQSQPKLTINAGVGCLNAAGDTLVVKSGVYDEILNNVIPSGSPGNQVTVKSEVQYGAIIRPATFGSTAYIISIMNGAHDIVLDGLVVDGINQTAVPYIGIALFTGSHDITIKNAEIMNGVDWHEGSSDFGLWV